MFIFVLYFTCGAGGHRWSDGSGEELPHYYVVPTDRTIRNSPTGRGQHPGDRTSRSTQENIHHSPGELVSRIIIISIFM